MIITVTRVVIRGGERVEKTASATIDHRHGAPGMLRDLNAPEEAASRYRATLTNTSRALFDALGEQ